MKTDSFQVMKFNEFDFANGNYLITAEPNSWILLNGEEMKKFKELNFHQGNELFNKLEEKGIILTKKNEPTILEKIRKQYSHLSHGITLHIINPTPRCNMNCLYCYADSIPKKSDAKDLDSKTVKKIIDFIYQCPSKSIVIEFQGGEPLENFDGIRNVVEEVKKRKGKEVHFRLVTNLSLMDDDIAKYLKQNKVTDICTSLDGPKKVHDKNRPLSGASSYEKVSYWLKRLKTEFAFKDLHALPTITKQSLPFAKEIVDEYLSHGFSDITPVILRRVGRGKSNWDKIGYSPEEYISFWNQMLDYCISLSKKGERFREMHSVTILEKISGRQLNHTCYSKPCGAASMQASYTSTGEIYSCDEGKAFQLFQLGNVFENSYEEVFTSANAMNLVNISSSMGLICNNCSWTNFCWICPVESYGESGNPIPNLSNDFMCKIKKAQIESVFRRMLFSKDSEVLSSWIGKGKF